MTDTHDASHAVRGVMHVRYHEDDAPTRVVVRLGADDDDRSGYAETATAYTDFDEALRQLHALRADHPDACMRFMYNEPDLGFASYWEVDPDAASMEARVMTDPRYVTYRALEEGGLPREQALRLSGMWSGQLPKGQSA